VIEEWIEIPGYEGKYQASNFGNIKSVNRITKTVAGQRTYKGKVLSAALHSHGYLVVNLRLGAKGGKVFYVHRLVALCFLGKSDLFVNHKNTNKTDNNIANLEYVTNKENNLHAWKNGVLCGKARLNEQERSEIRKLRAAGLSLKTIAKQFNMSESAISEVARGTTWG